HLCAHDGRSSVLLGAQPGRRGGRRLTQLRDGLQHVRPGGSRGGHLFSTIRAGHRHTCAVTTSGDAYCWGANSGGQLGRDTLTSTCTYAALNPCSNWPIPVAGGLIFTQVSAGWEHSCGVTTGGSAYCWGLNDSGQLGNDSTSTICGALEAPEPPRLRYPCGRVPRLVEGGLTFTSVQAGGHFTCGLAVTGDAYCWGYGLDG